jgi:hypothetical protein
MLTEEMCEEMENDDKRMYAGEKLACYRNLFEIFETFKEIETREEFYVSVSVCVWVKSRANVANGK